MLHHFILLPATEMDREAQFLECFHSPHALHLHDDIMVYIGDSLSWVASSNPGNPGDSKEFGLNRTGPTAIEGDGAAKFTEILRVWAKLFTQGPPGLCLTGEYRSIEDEDEEGAYEELRLDRDKLVSDLRNIADMASKADGVTHWLLHMGV